LPFLKQQTLSRQVLLVGSVLLLPLLGAILWSARQTRLERQTEVRDESMSVAVTAAASLDEYLRRLDALASVLVRTPAVIAFDRPETERLFTDLLHDQPLLTNVVLATSDGTLQAAGVSAAPLNGQARGSWPGEVVQSGEPRVGEFGVARTGKPSVTFAYPVRRDAKRVVAALGLVVDLTQLQAAFADIPLPPDSVITVVDRSNRILVRSRDASRFVGTTIAPINWSALPGTADRTDVDGVERISGDVNVKRAPWALTVGIPQTIVAQRLLPLWRRNVAIAVMALGSFLLLSLWLARQMSVYLGQLRSAVRRIADGDLSPPSPSDMPNLEFAQLQDGFGAMAANLRHAQGALDRQVAQERKLNETLQSLQRQVVRQERLAAVGLLASGVAHEMNNPLQAIVGAVELLERQSGLSADALEQLHFVKTQTSRAREVVRSLARFSSHQIGPPAALDLNDIVADVLRLRSRELEMSTVAVDVHVTTHRRVYANLTELEQVTSHLLLNAIQAVEAKHFGGGGGRIEIRGFDTDRNVRLEIHDNGVGVELADEPKLFQPFFTTKKVGAGSGLSLSVSYGIIESYGGDIGYFRNPWGGATFYYELPALAQSTDSPASPPRGGYDEPTDDRAPLLRRPL
jgi:C4-dicarboxylate-specific signal transduction histidine kinase